MKRLGNYNKIMVLGTAATDDEGELYLSNVAKSRCDRAAEAYFGNRFKRTENSVLITGGYSRVLSETPPVGREARLMANYLINRYSMPPSALLLEDESTSTIENFTFSKQQYPEFFEEIVNGERKLALVSQDDHLAKAALIGSWVLTCSERQFVKLPTRELTYTAGKVANLERVIVEPQTAQAADA